MDQIYTQGRIRVRKEAIISIKRSLPQGQGKIFVAVGQEVSPEQIIGEGQVTAGFRTIHLAKELKVGPKEALKHLKVKMGQTVFAGELLAIKEGVLGLGKKNILVPADGIIDFYDPEKGDLRLKLLPKVLKLVSGVFGVVEQVDQSRGFVIVRTMASIVYGVLGSGGERSGILNLLGSSDSLISSRQIGENLKGQIIVGGGLILSEALERAINLGINGVISGGIHANEYRSMVGSKWNLSDKHWSDVGISLLVTEGFGSIPIGEDIFSVLKSYNGRFVIIDGNQSKLILPTDSQNCMMYIQRTRLPAKVIVRDECMVGLVPIKIGATARIVSPLLIGVQGKIVSIDRSPTELSSGIKTIMVTVETKTRKVRIPYTNLEVLS